MRWIPFFNLSLVIMIALSSVGIIALVSKKQNFVETPVLNVEKQLPKRLFDPVSLGNLDQGPLSLKWVEPSLQLPNLLQFIHYHGLIQRPDIPTSQPRFHISLTGDEDLYSVDSGRPFYLAYRNESLDATELDTEGGPLWGKSETSIGYYPTKERTSLWLEMTPKHGGKLLEVTVHMIDEKGQELLQPIKHRTFTLNPQDPKPGRTTNWELGDYRVDSTLLIRQKARWVGADLFLQQHGGEAYSYTRDRERVDFNLGENIYSCFIKAGDSLVWKQGKWHEAYLLNEPTLGLPLLAVKKVEDKLILFELWDADGISKIPLNLIRARDMGGLPDMLQEFRFVGAKTWAQFIVESRSERLLLRAHDWLVLTHEGWVKLDSTQKIDDFVSQKLIGPLLVLDKLSKQNGKQVLTGHLFNTTRSDVAPIEMTASMTTYANQYAPVPASSLSSEPLAHGDLE